MWIVIHVDSHANKTRVVRDVNPHKPYIKLSSLHREKIIKLASMRIIVIQIQRASLNFKDQILVQQV